MAEALFRVGVGVSLNDDVKVVYGSADPSSGGYTAPIGSIYMRTTDGALWHKIGAGDTDWNKLVDSAGASTEDGYQNTFIGKDSTGDVSPDYSSTNVVTDSESLETSIGALDAEIGAAVSAETRTFGPISDQAINLNVTALDNAIGSDAEHANTDHTTQNASVNTKISELDGAMSAVVFKKSAADQTFATYTTVDTVTTDLGEWHIKINSNATPGNCESMKVVAMHDGTSSVDYTTYAGLKLGSAISGLDVKVVDSSGSLALQIQATEDIDYTLTRTQVA